jgi:hypothetical protein
MGRTATYDFVVSEESRVCGKDEGFGQQEFVHLVRRVCNHVEPYEELVRAFRLFAGADGEPNKVDGTALALELMHLNVSAPVLHTIQRASHFSSDGLLDFVELAYSLYPTELSAENSLTASPEALTVSEMNELEARRVAELRMQIQVEAEAVGDVRQRGGGTPTVPVEVQQSPLGNRSARKESTQSTQSTQSSEMSVPRLQLHTVGAGAGQPAPAPVAPLDPTAGLHASDHGTPRGKAIHTSIAEQSQQGKFATPRTIAARVHRASCSNQRPGWAKETAAVAVAGTSALQPAPAPALVPLASVPACTTVSAASHHRTSLPPRTCHFEPPLAGGARGGNRRPSAARFGTLHAHLAYRFRSRCAHLVRCTVPARAALATTPAARSGPRRRKSQARGHVPGAPGGNGKETYAHTHSLSP